MHKTGHVARYCPNKRRGKEISHSNAHLPNRDCGDHAQETPHKTPFRRYENARSAQIEEVEEDDEQQEEETHQILTYRLAVRTAAFSDEQKEQWVEAMKDLGVDFQQA